ncbi:MAG: hypothetical protein OHK0052_27420 [Anaerolineales bacterium]
MPELNSDAVSSNGEAAYYRRLADSLLQTDALVNQPVRLRVTSGSMRPLLNVNDFVLVQPVTFAELHRGDVVVFRRAETWITHRVAWLAPNVFFTWGDAMPVCDPPNEPPALLGRVSAIERGKTLWVLHAPTGARIHRGLANLQRLRFHLLYGFRAPVPFLGRFRRLWARGLWFVFFHLQRLWVWFGLR